MSKKNKKEDVGIEEQTVATSAPKVKAKKRDTFDITAKENANLPDGTFVSKGDKVEVSAEFVERLKRENDSRFIISQ